MSLTAKEICEIINCCKESPVSEINISQGKLRIVFHSKPIEEIQSTTLKPKDVAPSSELGNPIELIPEIDQKVIEERDDIAELQIADPARYEELIGLGELVDGDKEEINR